MVKEAMLPYLGIGVGLVIGVVYVAIMEKLGGKAPLGYAILKGLSLAKRAFVSVS